MNDVFLELKNLYGLGGVAVAALLGALIGIERELQGKPAGLRTNTLIAVGAALFAYLSVVIGATYNFDHARIAAQIVTGVGFIGAGSIIQSPRGVRGLTTAATMWVVAAVGTACGLGFPIEAFIVTVITLVILGGIGKLEYAWRHRTHAEWQETVIIKNDVESLEQLLTMLSDMQINAHSVAFNAVGDHLGVTISHTAPQTKSEEFHARLKNCDRVLTSNFRRISD